MHKFAPIALPYSPEALSPHISARTIEFHYSKHHKGYADKLNALIVMEKNLEAVTDLKSLMLQYKDKPLIFNNAAQIWNHDFLWLSMSPNGGGIPNDTILLEKLNKKFGNYDTFFNKFVETGVGCFGSGWVWIILDNKDDLGIISTLNADSPLLYTGITPLAVCDVWEHAYYLDYQNKRQEYLEVFLKHLINWDFCIENIAKQVAHN